MYKRISKLPDNITAIRIRVLFRGDRLKMNTSNVLRGDMSTPTDVPQEDWITVVSDWNNRLQTMKIGLHGAL